MEKLYLNKDVYTAFCERMDFIFQDFDNIFVSFSGGKDSGTLLQLVFRYIEERNITKRIGIFHQDFEAQYQKTTEYVERIFEKYEGKADLYWSCMPMGSRTALSSHEMYWYTWDPEKKDQWIREMPQKPYVYNMDNNDFDFYEYKMLEETFYKKFGKYYHIRHGGGKTCCLIGTRADESLHRYSAIVNKKHGYEGKPWITEQYKDVYSAAPLYDWRVEDIWTAIGKFGLDYNRLYDLLYKAGLTWDQMRVASPFHDRAKESLELYRRIEPDTWVRLLGRVSGANFAAIYAKTKAMAYKSISLPKGMTWEEYTFFLLDTLPDNIRDQYLKKFKLSWEFQRRAGGSGETEKEIRDKEHQVYGNEGSSDADGIKSGPASDQPPWKRFCYCILKNDHLCLNIGAGRDDKTRIDALKNKYRLIIRGGKEDV